MCGHLCYPAHPKKNPEKESILCKTQSVAAKLAALRSPLASWLCKRNYSFLRRPNTAMQRQSAPQHLALFAVMLAGQLLAAATAFSMTPMERYTYDAGATLLPGAAEIK